jgi:crotonobetainyl-CoA:carnitine CoA-transferase CaiB-like acyl-CoA transferase
LRSPEARERRLVSRIEHPDLGWLPNIGLPFRFARTPVADPTPAPRIGEHSKTILTDTLGYADEAADALIAGGAVYGFRRTDTESTPS